MKKIIVAHSPDADDIFMYYAIKFGWVHLKEVKFQNLSLDIESLNKATLRGEYDICAISFALYPFVKNDFALLTTAISFGEGYGPKLIKKKGLSLKKNFTMALSGEFTTNAMLFRIKYPHAKIEYMNFLEIENAVLNGVVDAGVLIHESILTYNNTLEVEKELWDIWQELAKEELPLPLGGMCIRRSIPLHTAIQCEEALIKAVSVAHLNKALLCKMLIQRDLIRVNAKTLERYLDLYANENSIQLNEIQYRALDKLYEIGYKHGFYKQQLRSKDFIIPSMYNELRSQ